MRIAIDEWLDSDDIEKEAKSITTDIINHFNKINQYLGEKEKELKLEGIEETQLYKDIKVTLEARRGVRVDSEILKTLERVKKILSVSIYQQIWNSNIASFEHTIIGEAINHIETTSFLKDEYITQIEASKILGKSTAFVFSKLDRFDPKTINGRRMVRKNSVIAYKKNFEHHESFKNDDEYMDMNDVAEELNLSTHMVYKMMKEGDLADLTVADGKFIKKDYVLEYKAKREELRKKYNFFDYLGTQDSAKLFDKTPATISNWIKGGTFEGARKVGRNYEIPRKEVLRVMKLNGISNAENKLKIRDKKLYQFIKKYTGALEMKNEEYQGIVLEQADKNGFKDYMKETRESFQKGERVYIPDWVIEDYEFLKKEKDNITERHNKNRKTFLFELSDIALKDDYKGLNYKIRNGLLMFLKKENETKLKDDIYFSFDDRADKNKKGVYLELETKYVSELNEVREKCVKEGVKPLYDYVEYQIFGLLDNAIYEIERNKLLN